MTRRTVIHPTPEPTPDGTMNEEAAEWQEVIRVPLSPPQTVQPGKPISEWSFEIEKRLYDCMPTE
jgi:hypothetical protein